jgi:hypothetical protein
MSKPMRVTRVFQSLTGKFSVFFPKYRSSDGMKVDIAKEGIQKVGPLGVGVESASFEPTSGARIA